MSLIAVAALAAALQTAPAGIHRYEALTLSPDGSRTSTFELVNGSSHPVVTIRNAQGAIVATSDPCATCHYGDAAWSPDGRALAVVAADDKAGMQSVYVVEGGNVRLLATLKGTLDAVRWSSDGKSIAVLAVENPHKLVGATQAGAKQVGEIGIAEGIDEQRIAVVPAAGGALKMVSPGDTWVYEYDWTPDGQGFVATAAKGDGDNNWWTARLESFTLSGESRVIAAPDMQMNYPRMSPDGKIVYIIGGLMSDFPISGGDVFAVPFNGGKPINLTPGYKGTFTSLVSTRGGLLASLVTGGEVGLAHVDIRGVTPLSHAEISMSAGDARFAADASGKTMAAVEESFDAAAHIVRGPLSAPVAITHDNDALKPEYVAKSVAWSNEGFTVQGWLMGPKTEPGKTYPMVTIVHGGPSSAVTARFTTGGTAVDLVKAGYFVFQPNPRGSYGQGEAFVLSNRRDFGGGDLRDILTGIDAVEKIAPVDDKRLGIMGHSYGGLMTMWTVTHSQRFKAAVAGAGIANWSSYYGENGIDQWMIPFFGASFYDDPAIYDKLSPIRYIKDAHTPTFIYVGERDVECPAAQSLEFWHGLKAMGVPVSLVVYEGEGHGIRAPEHARDVTTRTVGWFDKYLK
ncbi:S9 family peptidase [Asticcacaulis solisilvae]|uniref:S9 family peptidase n=1 Tax=Asticcacaulis solisilvae TaxID=1217274 RepID=UPI003FD8ED90